MKPNIGLSDSNRDGVVKLLTPLLADEYVLYTKTRNFHWNVVGPQFNDLHKFFEGQYEELDDFVDEVAERIRQLGAPPRARLTPSAACSGGQGLLLGGEADGLADLGELAGVVVPVELEERPHEGRDVDLVDSHDLLEEGNARLAPEIGLAESVEIEGDFAALRVEGVHELLERHGLAPAAHIREARIDLHEGQILVGEGLEEGNGLPAGLEEKVREDLARRPFPGGVGRLHVRAHALELALEMGPALVDAGPEIVGLRVRHGGYRTPVRRSTRPPPGPTGLRSLLRE